MTSSPDSHSAWGRAAWQGIVPNKLWDCRLHLIGVGDGGGGVWVNPDLFSLVHPLQWLQR